MTEQTPNHQPKLASRPKVIIVGGGFGGMRAAKSMAKLPVDVTIVDRRNHHTFQPLLYQVALAVLSPANIAQPIRSIFRDQKNIQVVMDEVQGIDAAAKTVRLGGGGELPFDFLVLAAGATHSYFAHPEWARFAPGLKTIEDAIEIRRRVLLAFELAERQMLEHGSQPPLNFVVIGGGPTGVELSGAIADIARLYMRHDFRHIDPAKARILLIEGSPRVLAAYPQVLSAKAEQALTRLGVEVKTGTHVTNLGPGWVEFDGQRLQAAVTLWAAGVQASPLGAMLNVPLDRRGAVLVDDRLNPPGLPHVFVLGDMAHLEQDGRQIPGVAQPAMQMGDHAAKMIAADLAGRPRTGFRYFDKGDMATIGRMSAVAHVVWPVKAKLSGLPAWAAWLVIHIFFLIGFRSRLSVVFTWVWSFFTFSRSARLITGDQNLPGWQDHRQAENSEIMESATVQSRP